MKILSLDVYTMLVLLSLGKVSSLLILKTNRAIGLIFGLLSVLLLFQSWYALVAPATFYLLSPDRVQTLAFQPP